MKKRQERAFGKEVFLLGQDKYGQYLWLEAPSWDCGWYWGFGYVEEYTNHKNPANARDISMHTHWSSLHKDYAQPFDKTTFTESEYTKLKELFEQFYAQKKMAASYHRVNEEMFKHHNEEIIPQITGQIIDILRP